MDFQTQNFIRNLVNEVEGILAKVAVKKAIVSVANTTTPGLAYSWVMDAISGGTYSASKRTEVLTFLTFSKQVEDWKNVRRANIGTAGYTLERWAIEGRDIAKRASEYASLAFDSLFFNQVIQDAKFIGGNVVQAVENISKPDTWPWYVQLAAGLGSLYFVSTMVRNFKGK